MRVMWTIAARAVLSTVFVGAAVLKLLYPPEDPRTTLLVATSHGVGLWIVAAVEVAVGALMWTRYARAGLWCMIVVVVTGSVIYAGSEETGRKCGCFGDIVLGPVPHTVLGLAVLALSAQLLIETQPHAALNTEA